MLQRDCQKITVDGYANLAIVATLLATIQCQLLTSTLGTNNTAVQKAVNVFFFTSLLLSILGTILALLAARWFSMLLPNEAEYLTRCLDTDTRTFSKPEPAVVGSLRRATCREHCLSVSLYSGVFTTFAGLCCFGVGILTMIWSTQPTGVAVAATTVPLITCTFCIPFFLEHDHLYTIRELNLKRPAW